MVARQLVLNALIISHAESLRNSWHRIPVDRSHLVVWDLEQDKSFTEAMPRDEIDFEPPNSICSNAIYKSIRIIQ
ncbi:hypothetical protein RUM43_000644 [Polyplax serrata]|uniref:Uncharacterized protein n=1 Tax=Polyplax serrata TaxID=468196 RepID=A0AAN8SGC7_POLSC